MQGGSFLTSLVNLKVCVLGSIPEDIYLLRKKLENFSWFFLRSQVEAVIGDRCWALFPIQTTKQMNIVIIKRAQVLTNNADC